jgi:hypothetical protein
VNAQLIRWGGEVKDLLLLNGKADPSAIINKANHTAF